MSVIEAPAPAPTEPIDLGSPGPDPDARKPGQFARRGEQGVPLVACPTGRLTKTGPRAGLPTMVPYGRPSNLGKLIENDYNLQKWTERGIVHGVGIVAAEVVTPLAGHNARKAFDALAPLQLYTGLVGGDPDDQAWRKRADGAVVAAKRAAKLAIAAERGTFGHEITEADDDTAREVDWVAAAERGEQLDLDVEVVAAMLGEWRAMLSRTGLEILAIEATVVHDAWRQAGTLDRIAMVTRPLRFVVDGEIITIPAGTIVVLDLKTGKLRIDQKSGRIAYWHSYVCQVAAYAGGVPYDTDTDTRGVWPWEIDQKWAIIAHLPVGEALDGAPVCRLVLCDIAEGARVVNDVILPAKAWAERGDLLGHELVMDEPDSLVPVLEASLAAIGVTPEPGPTEPEVIEPETAPPAAAVVDPASPAGNETAAAESIAAESIAAESIAAESVDVEPIAAESIAAESVDVEPSPAACPQRAWLAEVLPIIKRHRDTATELKALWPADMPPMKAGTHTDAQVRQLCTVVASVWSASGLTGPTWPALRAFDAVEGETIDDEDYQAIRARLTRTLKTAAPEAGTIANGWVAEGVATGRPWSMAKPQDRTKRRHAIYRAVIALIAAWDGDDDCCRAALALVLPEVAQLAIPLGHALGSLTEGEATHLADDLIPWTTTNGALHYGADGRPEWRAHVAA